MRYGVWWLETVIAHYGHAEPIGGKWCVDRDGHPWTGDNERRRAEGRAHATCAPDEQLRSSADRFLEMRQTRHKDSRVAMTYIRHGSLFTDNAADGIEPEKK